MAEAPPSGVGRADTSPNPYAPPEAAVEDRFSEADVRRDGDRLVVTIGRGITSCCATCGRESGLRLINPRMLWRNPKGCAASLGTAAMTIAVIQLGLSGGQVLYAIAAMLLGFTVANVYWRSRRFRLSLAVCDQCRRRRWRYWTIAALPLIATFISAFYFEASIVALLLLYVVARRLQPGTLRPKRVVEDRVWLAGAQSSVLERFGELSDTQDRPSG
ncbi:MAG: hypothetical protein AAF458_03025 [Pseudomonadota bacterium]